MISLVKTARKYQRLGYRSLGLYRLGQEKAHPSRLIHEAIRAALNNTVTPEERAWIARIENLRAELSKSTEELTRTDYGAGTPDAGLTQEQMRAGVETPDTVGHVTQNVSKPPFWCLFLFKLIRAVRPTLCIEMGTAVGISAAYQAAGLRLNGHGTLTTLEGARSLAAIAGNNFHKLGLDSIKIVVGSFHKTLSGVLSTSQSVDYVFVDGHHDEKATIDYFEQLLPFLAQNAIVVFDDIAWSEGMKKAWQTIAHDSRVSLAVDLGAIGVCVINGSNGRGRYHWIPI